MVLPSVGHAAADGGLTLFRAVRGGLWGGLRDHPCSLHGGAAALVDRGARGPQAACTRPGDMRAAARTGRTGRLLLMALRLPCLCQPFASFCSAERRQGGHDRLKAHRERACK